MKNEGAEEEEEEEEEPFDTLSWRKDVGAIAERKREGRARIGIGGVIIVRTPLPTEAQVQYLLRFETLSIVNSLLVYLNE